MRNARCLLLVPTLLLLAGCAERENEFTDAEIIRVDQSVRVFMESVADNLERTGPLGWLDHFADVRGFFMASDGELVFPDLQTAEAFLNDFAPTVDRMEITWTDVRVDPLTERTAVVGAAYDESLTDTTGSVVRFGGYVTALAVDTSDGWRFEHLHWSSPAVDEPGE